MSKEITMKIIKRFTVFFTLLLTAVLAFSFTGCSAEMKDSFAPSGGSSGSSGGHYDSDSSESWDSGWDADPSAPESGYDGEYADKGDSEKGDPADDKGADKDGEGSGNQQKPVVKQLTAAEWRDALNYDFWLDLFKKDIPFKGQDGKEITKNAIFSEFKTATRGLETFEMHEVYVTCDDNPVVGASVSLYDESEVIYSAVTDSTGTAYVFGDGERVEATSGKYSASAEVIEGVTEISLTSYKACDDELEIMFVVDTTGSMGDELEFLCDELAGIVERVSSSLDCTIRLGLIFYRDQGDAYVTRNFDFVEVNSSKGLNKVIKNIKAQSSSGGGDYPEAVDRALKQAVNADWDKNSKTKLLFHVLDAPYHDEQENQSVFANAVSKAAQQGIRIIPVAASGFDTLGQYIMRSAALLTGGTYTFLTDDSGIGFSHELPAVGEFTVEYLSDLMVRLIKGYYTGVFEEPVPWHQSQDVQ